MTTKPTTPAAEALSAALGFRRVVRPASEQAADEQRRVLDEYDREISPMARFCDQGRRRTLIRGFFALIGRLKRVAGAFWRKTCTTLGYLVQ